LSNLWIVGGRGGGWTPPPGMPLCLTTQRELRQKHWWNRFFWYYADQLHLWKCLGADKQICLIISVVAKPTNVVLFNCNSNTLVLSWYIKMYILQLYSHLWIQRGRITVSKYIFNYQEASFLFFKHLHLHCHVMYLLILIWNHLFLDMFFCWCLSN
jgi:hypothetical protein